MLDCMLSLNMFSVSMWQFKKDCDHEFLDQVSYLYNLATHLASCLSVFRSCAGLPSKKGFGSLKTKLCCETSYKNRLWKLENEALAQDFLQKPHVNIQHILLTLFQYFFTCLKYSVCRQNTRMDHENGKLSMCWASRDSDISLQDDEFHALATTPFAIDHGCHRFYNLHELLGLPCVSERLEFPGSCHSKWIWSTVSKNALRSWVLDAKCVQILGSSFASGLRALWAGLLLSTRTFRRFQPFTCRSFLTSLLWLPAATFQESFCLTFKLDPTPIYKACKPPKAHCLQTSTWTWPF